MRLQGQTVILQHTESEEPLPSDSVGMEARPGRIHLPTGDLRMSCPPLHCGTFVVLPVTTCCPHPARFRGVSASLPGPPGSESREASMDCRILLVPRTTHHCQLWLLLTFKKKLK